MQQITINNTALNVGFSFKAIKNFEDLTKKSITQCVSTWDNLLFFYATLKALNPEFTNTLEEFTEIMDADPNLLIQFKTMETETMDQPQEQTEVKKKWETKQIFGLWMLFLLLSVSPVLIPVISIILWIGASLWLLTRLTAKAGKKPA